MIRFGDRFKRQTRWLGISEAEVARRVGIDPSLMGHYSNDRHVPKPDMFMAICRALQITPNQAYGIDPLPGDVSARDVSGGTDPAAEPPPTPEQSLRTTIRFDLDQLGLEDLEIVGRLTRDLARRSRRVGP